MVCRLQSRVHKRFCLLLKKKTQRHPFFFRTYDKLRDVYPDAIEVCSAENLSSGPRVSYSCCVEDLGSLFWTATGKSF